MKTILIANRGLSAIKFILSIRDLYTIDEIKLIGIATPDDITSDYRYISQLDKILFAENDIYTNIENIISLCLKNNIDAVFPGWGYLSENSEFSKKLEEHNIIFMGPSSQTIDSLGNKINSMKLAEENNVPLIKWSGSNPLLSLDDVIKSVYDIGIPCMIKEADGGGGKGIRIIDTLDKSIIEQNYHQIINEMHKDIGTVKLFVMELMENCHHIEVQLVGDGVKTIHLFGRDCTSQRRNQKLIEEGPITVAPDSIIKLCEDSAIKLAESVNYLGLGTAEFLYTPKNNKLTFLEINPRLQVEHIVTELLLNINLPTILYKLTCEKFRLEQIFTASFNYKTNTYFKKPNKHVIAVRLNAENVEENFKPSIGTVRNLELPNVVHSWSYISIHNGGKIINSVDAQFGHLFAIGTSRDKAINRMIHLINQIIIDSDVCNSLLFLKKILNTDIFRNNKHTTDWIRHTMFNKLNSNIIDLDNTINSNSVDLDNTINKNNITIDSLYWILGMINQGWYRWILYNNEYENLINNGHILDKETHSKISLGIKINDYVIYCKGTLYIEEKNIENWYSIKLDIINGTTYSIKCKLFPYSKSVCFIKLDDTLYRTQLHCFSDDYSVFNLNIGLHFYKFYKSVDPNLIISPITGKIITINTNRYFTKNETLIEIESMKMVFPINTTKDSDIEFVNTICVGDHIKEGDTIGLYKSIDNNEQGKEQKIKETIFTSLINNISSYLVSNDPISNDPISNVPVSNDPILNDYPIKSKSIIKKEDEFDLFSMLSILDYTNVYLLNVNEPGIEKVWDKDTFKQLSYEELFNCESRKCGVIGLVLEGPIKYTIICHHKNYNKCGFGPNEQQSFKNASIYSRINKIPRIYLCKTYGAYLDYDLDLVNDLIFMDNGIYIKKSVYVKWKDILIIDHTGLTLDPEIYKIKKIINNSITTLDGCSEIASETSLAYDTTFTLTYIYGYSVGIGAYLARLGHRVIQKKNTAMLLTGFRALNKLLGQNIYSSNNQLGGHEIMGHNGISQKIASSNGDAAEQIKLWLHYLHNCPIPKELNHHLIPANCLSGLETIVDNGLLFDTMPLYGSSLITGRCKIDNISFSVIGSNNIITDTVIPADNENLNSSRTILKRGTNVLYPESSYKMAQSIRDSNRENIPLILWMNWRGFSGGGKDMFDEILKFGSMIVDELRLYNQPIYAYLPPNSQLRGGAMVVMSSSINPKIKMWADDTSKIGILEPEAAYEIKYKKHIDSNINKQNIIDLINLYDCPYDCSILKIIPINTLKKNILLDIKNNKEDISLEEMYTLSSNNRDNYIKPKESSANINSTSNNMLN